jgi:hypothetical protein
MKKGSLHWYLLQEAILEEKDEETGEAKDKKPEKKKQEKPTKMKKTGVDPSKYGQPLPPQGRYTSELKLLIQQMRKKYGSSRLTAEQNPNELFKRLGQIPSSRGWTDYFANRIGKTSGIGPIIVGNGGSIDGQHVVQVDLDPKWKDLASNENSSRRFLCFYFSQILKAMGMEDKSDITMKNFEFRLSGNTVSIIQMKTKS